MEYFALLRTGLARIQGGEQEDSQLCFVPWGTFTPDRDDPALATA